MALVALPGQVGLGLEPPTSSLSVLGRHRSPGYKPAIGGSHSAPASTLSILTDMREQPIDGADALEANRPAGSSGGSHVSAPVEVPEDIVERIRRLCLALPEVAVRVD